MNFLKILSIFLLLTTTAFTQTPPAFTVVPLGVKGGLNESNLSAYMVAPYGTHQYVCFDAGTLRSGIEKAIAHGSFTVSVSEVLKQYIKAYFISHPHLDHVAGLVLNSPDDSAKTVYALPHCMQVLQQHYFNGESWVNFGDDGQPPFLKKYHFQTLTAQVETPVNGTNLTVTPFNLSHVNPQQSTAFLLKSNNNYVLYLGDTGADAVEKANNLDTLWQTIAPLVKNKQLKGIFIEASFTNEQPDNLLFGHLTPAWLMQEMENLSQYAGKEGLKHLPLIITHIKPSATAENKIKEQLLTNNTLQLQLIFPEQGNKFSL